MVILSEFGGYGYAVPGHTNTDKVFQYKGFHSKDELTEAIIMLFEREILPAKQKGLSASIYTQTSDVEDELNGLITYDRQIVKLDKDRIRALSKKVTEGNCRQ